MMAVFCDVPPLCVGVEREVLPPCSWNPECEGSSHFGSGVQQIPGSLSPDARRRKREPEHPPSSRSGVTALNSFFTLHVRLVLLNDVPLFFCISIRFICNRRAL